MRVYYCDHLEVELPAGHRFPMGKYRLLRHALVAQGVLAETELLPASAAAPEDLLRVHTPAYVGAFRAGTLTASEQRRLGFPWSPALVARTLHSVGGTILAGDAALEDGFGGTLAGGTHHAFPDHGAGYCAFNDIAVAACRLLALDRVARVLIMDVDVHQGDGTAAIFAGDERVFTVSIHGARNFPFRKQRSSLDVELPDGTADDAYLEALERTLTEAFDRGQPDVLFLQAGVDVIAEDLLGRLSLSLAGLAERDRIILAEARARGVPVVLTLGGGYTRDVGVTVAAHVGTYRVARSTHG